MTRAELNHRANEQANEAREVSRLLGMSLGQAFHLVRTVDQAMVEVLHVH